MTAQHTQGRLVAERGILTDAQGHDIAMTLAATDERDAADARRLAACWNAFEGIETERFEGKDLTEYVASEAYITGMQPADGGGMDLGLRGLGVQLLAGTMAGQFKANGAVNFLEVRLSHPETGPLLVTMQRLHGETPAQQKAAAIAERDQLRAALDAARALLAEAMPLCRPSAAPESLQGRIRTLLKQKP